MPRKGKKSQTDKLMESVENAVNTRSRPSELAITDLRVTRVAAPYDYILVRIDTNQGVYGLGESHEASHIENVLQYKSILLGQNPCNVDMLHKAMVPHGHHGTQGGGISGIEMALWDLIGRVYGVPCYQFFGGKYRDRIRLYADTPSPRNNTPAGYAQRVAERRAMGLTLIKFDTQFLGQPFHILRGIQAHSQHHHFEFLFLYPLVGSRVFDSHIPRLRYLLAY